MGAGRKTQTFLLTEKPQPHQTTNFSVSARNLKKSDLGAVIFGCKHNTITECLTKQLFGLPFGHFSYVKNVTPGLTLFLFNYSDRTLHGIFEAASPGQLNINPHGWTVDGDDTTSYPAQVRIRVRKKCRALQEEEFGPIIADNYYGPTFFWFELDCTQTRKLIDLFFSSPSSSLAPPLRKKALRNRYLNGVPSCGSNEASAVAKDAVSEDISSNRHKVDKGQVIWASSPSPPQRSWSSLFKNSAASDSTKKKAKLKKALDAQASASLSVPDQSNVDWEYTSAASLPEICGQHFEASAKYGKDCEASQDKSVAEGYEEPAKQDEHFEGSGEIFHVEGCGEPVDWKLSRKASSIPATKTNSLPLITSLEHLQIMHPREEGGHLKSVASALHLHESHELKTDWDAGIHEDRIAQPLHAVGEYLKGTESSDALAVGEFRADNQSLVAKLIRDIGEMKGLQLKQNQKLISLEQELVQSKLEIQLMRNQYNLFTSKQTPSSNVQFKGTDFESFNGLPESNDSILIVGGYDGSAWLPDLSSYSPSSDFIKSLTPMTFIRSYTSAAKLNGELYLFGGVHNDVWYNTVESYNPRSNHWSVRPPLNKKKGSLAGVSVSEKLFAIGGGNGVECFREVEMFDVNVGKWIYVQPMQQKRYAPAVADINGTIYVVGGYDGRDYLKSVERFDPREHKWMGVASLNSRRGCHSLVALHGKLYSLGGYDGKKMVSTVEVFDPRACSWIKGEAMKAARGYSGAVVVGEKIYVIGGVTDSEEVLDTVECYEEGYGWGLTDLKAVGKRSFFSALVL